MATSERASTMACALLAAVLALSTANEAVRGQAAAATAIGSISGVVISDDPSARPIARVAVTLRSAALPRPLQFLTDEAGRFSFTGLPAASFTITAAKPSYLTLSYGQATAGRGSGLPIVLEAGQQLRDLRLVLPRGAVISGRVVDDRSRPVANAPIQVLQYRTMNGERTLTNVGGNWPQTDAHGGYRAYGLPPGDYLVCAHPPGDFTAIPQDCRPGGGGEGAREVAAAEVQWARQQIQALSGLPPICPDSPLWWRQMFTALLPPCDPGEGSRRLWEEFQVEVPVGEREGQPRIRVSIQAYTHPWHIERLLEGLRRILPI